MSSISNKVGPTVRILTYDKTAQELIEQRIGIPALKKNKSGGRSYLIPQALIDLTFQAFEEMMRW